MTDPRKQTIRSYLFEGLNVWVLYVVLVLLIMLVMLGVALWSQ
jgi:hypothetical protein